MNLTQLLNRNTLLRPEQEAVCYGDISFTYRQFQQRVACLASGFKDLNIPKEACISLLSMNSHRYLEVLFATPWYGAVFNLINIRWSAAEIAYCIVDSKSTVLMVDDSFITLIPEIKKLAPQIETIIYVGNKNCPADMIDYENMIENSVAIQDSYRQGDELAGIFYTGGTTGKSKGVMLSHTNLVTFGITASLMAGIEEEPRFLTCAPLFHIAGLGLLLMSFTLGGTQILVPGFVPENVIDIAKKQEVNAMLLVPTMVQMLLDSPAFTTDNFKTLKNIVYGASPMPSGTMSKALDLLPHVGFVQGYGMTECGLVSISPSSNHTLETLKSGKIFSAGTPGHVQQLRIVDEYGVQLSTGEVGEVTVRGSNVMLGYWDKPELTANTIKNGWLYTGDGGYIDENGFLFIVDRLKDIIITGGENVYSSEVEAIISKHDAVAQCAVIGLPSSEWGETVHAVIVLASGVQTVSNEEIRNFCKAHIAGYKCPKSIDILPELPISGAGKILKSELRKPYWEKENKKI